MSLESPQTEHFASLTEPAQVALLLRALWGYDGGVVVRAALKLAPMLFARPGEWRAARWGDIDLDAKEWCYIATKTGTAHIVPLRIPAETYSSVRENELELDIHWR